MADHKRHLANLPTRTLKPHRLLTIAIAAVLLGAGCSGDYESLSAPGEYLVFGDFYGECLGEGCVDIFKVVDRKLFEDTLDNYPLTSELPHVLQLVARPADRYDDIVGLIGDVPAKLFDEKRVVIGQPDAGDWGGFYLETNVSGSVRYWLIDKEADNLPKYLRDYALKLEEAIQIAGG